MRVPTYDQPRVNQSGIPDARITAVPSPDAFGASAAQAVGHGIANIALTEQAHADDIFATAKADELGRKRLDYIGRIRAAKGENAFALPEQLEADWQKDSSDILATARSGRQREALSQMVDNNWLHINGEMQSHIANERQQYDAEKTDSYIKTQGDIATAAATAPINPGESLEQYTARIADNVTSAAANARGAIIMHGLRNGKPPEVLEQQEATVKSQMYANAVNAQLNQGNDRAAKGLYDRFGDLIVGDDKLRVEHSLDIASTRGESQRQADEIVAKAGDNMSEALAAVRKIDDPKIRAAAHDLVKEHFADTRQAQEDERNQLFLNADRAMTETGGDYRRAVPAEVEARLTGAQIDSLKQYSRRIRDGEQPVMEEGDGKGWKLYLSVPSDPKALAKIPEAEIYAKYRPALDDPHFNRVVEDWRNAREAVAKGDYKAPELSSTLTFKDRIDNALRGGSAPLIPPDKERSKFSGKEATLYGQFETAAARAIENYELTELGGKRKASGEEMQKKIDELLVNRVFIDKSGYDPSIPAGILTDEQKGHAYVPIDQIPKETLDEMRNIIRSNNRPITEDKLQRMRAARLMGDRARYLQIAAE